MEFLNTANELTGAAFDLLFSRNPIILKGGIASVGDLGYLPVSLLYGGLLSDFATFTPQSGTLISNTIAKYPFFDSTEAANATYRNANFLSFEMTVKCGGGLNRNTVLLRMESFKRGLEAHIKRGGLFMLITKYGIQKNAILTNLSLTKDEPDTMAFSIDFEAPLVDTEDAETRYNDTMKKLSGQLPTEKIDVMTLFNELL